MQQKTKAFLLVRVARKLMLLQVLLLAISTFISQVALGRHMAVGIMLGGMIALMPTLIGMVFFMRMPEVVGAKAFYTAMLLYEALKWLVVIGLGAYSVHYLSSIGMNDSLLGLVAGFAFCYSAYFLMYLNTNYL